MEGRETVAHRVLAAGEVLRLQGGHAIALEVASGVVWLTLPGNRDDLLLEEGNRIALAHGGLALAEALRPAEVRVTMRDARATARQSLTESFRAWRRET